jgi:hypothetical protein
MTYLGGWLRGLDAWLEREDVGADAAEEAALVAALAGVPEGDPEGDPDDEQGDDDETSEPLPAASAH